MSNLGSCAPPGRLFQVIRAGTHAPPNAYVASSLDIRSNQVFFFSPNLPVGQIILKISRNKKIEYLYSILREYVREESS